MKHILALLFVLVGGSAWGQCSTSNYPACPGYTSPVVYGGPINIGPMPGSLLSAITTSQSGAGTPSVFPPGSSHAAFTYNLLNINSDTVNALAGPSGSQNAVGLDVPMIVGGTGTTGNHIGIFGGVTVDAVPTTAGSYVGMWEFAQASVNLGGVSGTPAGFIYGANPQANALSAATYLVAVVGEEVDAFTAAAPQDRFGINIVSGGAVTPSQGAQKDAAMAIGGLNWGNGILITNYNGGSFPLASTATIIGSDVAGTVAYGINLSNITCSDLCYASPGFQDNGAGTIKVLSSGSVSAILDSAASNTAYINFESNNALKWFVGNNSVNQFIAWDQANSAAFLLVDASGNETVGEGANVTINGTLKTGATAAVSCAANTVSLTTLVVTNGIVTHC